MHANQASGAGDEQEEGAAETGGNGSRSHGKARAKKSRKGSKAKAKALGRPPGRSIADRPTHATSQTHAHSFSGFLPAGPTSNPRCRRDRVRAHSLCLEHPGVRGHAHQHEPTLPAPT